MTGDVPAPVTDLREQMARALAALEHWDWTKTGPLADGVRSEFRREAGRFASVAAEHAEQRAAAEVERAVGAVRERVDSAIAVAENAVVDLYSVRAALPAAGADQAKEASR